MTIHGGGDSGFAHGGGLVSVGPAGPFKVEIGGDQWGDGYRWLSRRTSSHNTVTQIRGGGEVRTRHPLNLWLGFRFLFYLILI
jgi:hypothetical protein